MTMPVPFARTEVVFDDRTCSKSPTEEVLQDKER